MKQRTGPLADIRIIDLTQFLAGPFCTMLLADLGADVIKVEPPAGDPTRKMGPLPRDTKGCDYGGYFASVNRNKRSIVLDLKNEADREALLNLSIPPTPWWRTRAPARWTAWGWATRHLSGTQAGAGLRRDPRLWRPSNRPEPLR